MEPQAVRQSFLHSSGFVVIAATHGGPPQAPEGLGRLRLVAGSANENKEPRVSAFPNLIPFHQMHHWVSSHIELLREVQS